MIRVRRHRRLRPTRWLRLAVIAAGMGWLWVAMALPASAHAALVASQPEAGADLAAAPGVVRLRFTEPLIEALSSVTVTDPVGQTFTGGPTGDRDMQVDVNSTAQGPYTVEWKTVSPIDGHTLTGRFEFGVATAVGSQPPPSDDPGTGDLAVAVWRALEYAGLLGTLGLLSLSSLADGAEVGWRPRGVHRWVAVAFAGGAGTIAGELLLATSGSLGAATRALLSLPTGQVRLARLVIELVAMALAVTAARRAGGRVEPRLARAGVLVLTMAALATLGWAGHAAASGSAGVWAATGHLWAAGVWAGTILAMTVHRPPGGWRAETGHTLVREFTPIALASFSATAVLGILRAVQELAHPADLWATAYGQVLTAKTTIVAAMVGLSWSAWHRARQAPRGEGLAAAGVVVLAAVLVAFPVPPGRAGEDPTTEAAADTQGRPRPGDLTLAQPVADTVVGLSIRPAQPGINDLVFHLVPPGDVSVEDIEVTVAIDDDTPAPTRRCGDPCRLSTAPLRNGTRVTVRLEGHTKATGRATFTIPKLPATAGVDVVEDLTSRMRQIQSVRYDETFGPSDPPITSTWELILPDRLHGTISGPRYRETIRIDDRWWNREAPDDPWTEAPSSRTGLSVKVDRFIWDVDPTNQYLVGHDTIDGTPTRVVAFYAEIEPLPIWYRLWVDDDDRVRRAIMLTQGHFMDQYYYDFDQSFAIEPPTTQRP